MKIGLLLILFAMALARGAGDDARVQDLYAQAKAAQARGDVATAIARYEEILRVSPQLAAAYNNLGALYFRQQEYKQAAAVLKRGLKIDAAMPTASALLGISLYELGDDAEARTYLEAALKANPQDVNAQMFQAKVSARLGDYEAAAAGFQKLATRQPKNQEVWYELSKVYMKLSENAMAKINSIDPDSVLAHQLSGEMMESMNNYDGAVVELKKAVDLEPRRRGAHYLLGDAYWNLSQWASATEQFRAELAIDPGNCKARWKIGAIILQGNGDAEEALRTLNQALTTCPGLTQAHVDRARTLLQLNRVQDAIGDLEIAEKAEPAEPATHFLLAKAYRAAGRGPEAQAEMGTFSKLEEAARTATAERAREVIKNKESAH